MRIIYYLIAFSICSCSLKDTNIRISFSDNFSVKGIIGSEIYSEMAGISIFDTVVVVNGFNLSVNQHILSFYNLSSTELIKRCLTVGNGPNEIKVPGLVKISGDYLFLHDFISKKLYEFNVDYLLFSNEIQPDNIYSLDENAFFIDYLPDDEFLISYANRSHSDVLISFMNKEGLSVESNNIIDEIKPYDCFVDADLKRSMGLFSYAIHPFKPLYAFAFRFNNTFAITNNNGNVLVKLEGERVIQKTLQLNMQSWFEAYGVIKCDENYIYCAYKGVKFDRNNPKQEPVYAKNIHIFSWDGNPIANIELDHPLQDFDISCDQKKIIIISQRTGTIVTYDMPVFTKK